MRRRPSPTPWVLAGSVSLLAWLLLVRVAPGATIPWTPAMLDAARRMERGVAVVREHCDEAGISMPRGTDPNGTCLIGPDYSELFTTLGQVEAKRTTTNPDLAGLLVHLLREAGVGEGDTVAVAASGSFPALMLAALTAVESMGARPVTLLSLGASSYGATRPELDLLDLHALWHQAGVLETPVAGASLGGAGDVGGEFEPDVRARLADKIRAMGIAFLDEEDLGKNVRRRMELYVRPAAFVNIGGSEAAMGRSPSILEVPPGLSVDLFHQVSIPPTDLRGVLFEMAAAGVPVLHLLHIRGIALRFAVPWDPIPLPPAGTTRLREGSRGTGSGFWLLTFAYAVGLAAVAVAWRRVRVHREPVTSASAGSMT